jgi:hypothetical protein
VNLDINKYENIDNTPPKMAIIIPIILLIFIKANPANIALNEIAAKRHIIVSLKLDAFECDFSKDDFII